jgi:hypothetical protein
MCHKRRINGKLRELEELMSADVISSGVPMASDPLNAASDRCVSFHTLRLPKFRSDLPGVVVP